MTTYLVKYFHVNLPLLRGMASIFRRFIWEQSGPQRQNVIGRYLSGLGRAKLVNTVYLSLYNSPVFT